MILLCIGCDRDVPVDFRSDVNYYPLDSGHTLTYQVDTIHYNPLFDSGRKQVMWQVREVVDDTFLDLTGRVGHRIQTYHRKSDSLPWQTGRVYAAYLDESHLERLENNLRFIALTFPIMEASNWDGNGFIPSTTEFKPYWNYHYSYTQIDQPASINGLMFDSTVIVHEAEPDGDLLVGRYSESRYAREVGLYYRKRFYLEVQDSVLPDPFVPWEDKADIGFITTWSLVQID